MTDISTESSPTNKTTEELQQEINVFGGPIDAYLESVEASTTFKYGGIAFVIMGELTDAQAFLAKGEVRGATRAINRANHMIAHYQIGLATPNVRQSLIPQSTQPTLVANTAA